MSIPGQEFGLMWHAWEETVRKSGKGSIIKGDVNQWIKDRGNCSRAKGGGFRAGGGKHFIKETTLN